MRKFLRQLGTMVWPYRQRLVFGVLGGLVYSLGNGALVLVVKLVCDVLFPTAGVAPLAKELEQVGRILPALRDAVAGWLEQFASQSAGALGWLVASVPFVMAVRGMGQFLSTYSMSWVAAHTVHDLRSRLFSHLQGLSLDFYATARTGDLQSRIGNDTLQFQINSATAFTSLAREPLTIAVLVSFLMWQHARLTAVALVVFPLCVVPIVLFGKKVRKSWKAAQSHTAELSDLMQENFTSQRIVQAYNLQQAMSDRFVATSRRITGQFLRFVRASEIPGPLIEFFGALGVGVLFLYVARISTAGGMRMTSGDFFSFIGSLFMLYQPVKNLARLWAQLEQGRAAMSRLDELLDVAPTIVEPARPAPLKAKGAAIEFRDVEFSYGDKPALNGISLRVEPGQLVALVGASGSGKTSLTSLLLRFYDPQRGAITIGGTDLRQASLAELRRQIAVVTQDTVLFNESVRDNLLHGRPGATPAEVEAAARAAHAHEFILAKPGGYDFVVGERGGNLSGGQRQRLAIARALLRDAPILILDEATSALDSESERAVQAALERLMQGRTTLCIAHRLSTIARADQIVVLHEGRIVEQGTQAELLARNGHFARLHALQAGA